MKKLFSIPLIVVTLGVLAGCSREPYKYDAFADCLTEKGIKMYGTEWCPHCKDQKKLFGPSLDKVDYINCEVRVSQCSKAGIEGYPTWILQDGTKLAGTQNLSTLAEKTDCALL